MALSDFHIPNAGSATNPALTFGDDLDSGLYSVGPNVVGLAAGGTLTSQLNNRGVLNGTISGASVDGRNLIRRVYGDLRRNDSPTLDAATASPTYVSSSVGFSYTPLSADSILKIQFLLSVYVGESGSNVGASYGVIRYYMDTTLIPNLGIAIPGTSTQILNDQWVGTTVRNASGFAHNVTLFNPTIFLKPNTTSNRFFYLGFATTNAINIFLKTATGQSTQYCVEEYL